MKKMIVGYAATMLCLLAACAAETALSVSTVFSDHMVLQRERPIRVWGLAPEGTRVAVAFADASVEAVAGKDGDWCAELPALPACTKGRALTVSTRAQALSYSDVLVGDVWLMSGQSNMEYPFCTSWGAAADAAKADARPNVRRLRVNQTRALFPRRNADCGEWQVCTSNLLMTVAVSAVGYVCARELNAETGIPQGIIEIHWGGCLIEPFVPLEGYRTVPEFNVPYVSDIERAQARYTSDRWNWNCRQDCAIEYAEYLKKCRAEKREPDRLPHKQMTMEGYDPFCSTAYNAMVAPLVRFPVAGCFWYQGESNLGRWNYGKMLKAMVGAWRTAWGIDFPVYVCQLSSVNQAGEYLKLNSARARFRDIQRRVVPELGKSGLVVTTDVGAEYEHPRNKIDVGLRCARWALRDVYGRKDLVVSGPLFKGFRREGDGLRVSFDHVGGGLMAADKAPDTPYAAPIPKDTKNVKGFAVYGEDRLWHDAEAVIDGDEIVVSALGVREPKELRYAHMDNTIGRADLYNAEGLPAAGFRTDDFDWQNK